MREKLHTAVCMLLVLVVFTGCKGMGALVKVAFVAAYVATYVGVKAIAASSKRSSSESSSPPPESNACSCAPVAHGQTWCERINGDYQCVLECESGHVFRDGICVPREVY
jgi:hypothetical protein